VTHWDAPCWPPPLEKSLRKCLIFYPVEKSPSENENKRFPWFHDQTGKTLPFNSAQWVWLLPHWDFGSHWGTDTDVLLIFKGEILMFNSIYFIFHQVFLPNLRKRLKFWDIFIRRNFLPSEDIFCNHTGS